ncbi:hypothetical protein GCM10023322_64250 [Rugosimonospora acidiphila]|uniref:DUF4232 domain-containing protein n=1 Tax=Rugosimonospora acidiphila TaxID=556531 RepID=A0ABP9SHW5_9ACTN
MVAKLRVALAGCAALLAAITVAGCGSSHGHPYAGPGRSTRAPVVALPDIDPGLPLSAPPLAPAAGKSAGAGTGGAISGGGTGIGGGTGSGSGGSGTGGSGTGGVPDAGAGSGGGAGGATVAPAPGCAAGALSLKQRPGDNGAAGQIVVAIQLTNGSSKPCSLSGYPTFTLSAPTPSGTPVTEPVTLSHGRLGSLAFGDPAGTVNLAAGGQSGFLVRYSEVQYGDGSCVATDTLHLALPGSAGNVAGPVRMQVCGEPMLVSPFVPPPRLSIG